jgi:hypothetical protein
MPWSELFEAPQGTSSKVQRVQTDHEEFWAITDPQSRDQKLHLAEWQHYYNWDRSHVSLNGHTPIDALSAKQEATPFCDEVKPDMTRLGNDSRSLITS